VPTRIKICGVTTPEIATAACASGADALGLVFYAPSKRAVTPERGADIVAALAPLVMSVGLFVDPDPAEVDAVLAVCALDCLQFHGSESAAFCAQFQRPYIKAVSMRPDVNVAAVVAEHSAARAFLFDAWREDAPGGTGDTFDWRRLPAMQRPWMLAGGLSSDNVGTAIEQLAPPAVDVSGGVESTPGVKDPVRIRQFIDAVREADQRKHEDAAA
jgi:phosphoribosylanthranilate isomerase